MAANVKETETAGARSIRRVALNPVAAVLAVLTIASAGAAPARQGVSDADLLSSFVTTHYAYLDVKKIDWKAATRYYREQYALAGSDRARFGVLERMLDDLYDPHSHLTSNYRDSWRLPAYDIWAQPRRGSYVVTEVRFGSPAQKAGIRAGDEIVAIDGRPVRDAVAARLPRFLRSPDPVAQQWALLSALSGRHDRSRTLELRDAALGSRSVTIPISPKDDVVTSSVSSRTIGGVAYISVRSFADAAIVAQFDRALEPLKGVKALIVDVRNNTGVTAT